MTIVLTGTHLTPAIATIQALTKKAPGARLVYVGRKHTGTAESVEKEEIERVGAEFAAIKSGKFHRRLTFRLLPEMLKIPAGIWQAFRLVRKYKPDVVVSFGGYSSVPMVLAGKLGGAKIVIHEQTAVWGAANKLVSFLADVKAVSWRETARPGAVWTGNPVRQEVLKARGVRRGNDPRQHFFDTLGLESSLISSSPPGQSKSKVLSGSSSVVSKMLFSARPSLFFSGFPVLYITGGNQGSKTIDKVVEKILPDLVEKFEVFHQTKSKIKFKHPRYHPAKWFPTPIHAEILSKAAVSVSRAGANTVTELIYLGIPSILVPLPGSAGGEQQKNARIMVETGLGKIIRQQDLTPEKLLAEIYQRAKNKDQVAKIQRERLFIREDAAERLAEIILKLGRS